MVRMRMADPKNKRTVLIVEGDDVTFGGVKSLLLARNIEVTEGSWTSESSSSRATKTSGVEILRSRRGAVRADGVHLARQVRDSDYEATILLVAECSSEERVLAALRAGVTDYFKISACQDELMEAVQKRLSAAERSGERAIVAEQEPHPEVIGAWRLIGCSVAVREIKRAIQAMASTESTVLITGETGTGKELVADLIQKNSSRCSQPFVRLNCAAMPETLLESELFGYEKGAFTGADGFQRGKLELAKNGTLLMDEIGDMSLSAQAKLLRVLENEEFYRLGGHATISANIRIITATHQNLERLAEEGRFRKDVYFRLAVARIALPPLRERKEDIADLADHYIRHFNEVFHREVEALDEELLQDMLRYDWPGNIRQLKNFIEAAFVNRPGRMISVSDLPSYSRALLSESATASFDERDKLLLALSATKWNKSKAAERLQWSRMTLYRKLAKYQLLSTNAAGPVGDDVAEMTPSEGL
jgi:DNA-binding NtrC family response regulator